MKIINFVILIFFLTPFYCLGQSSNNFTNKRIEYLINKNNKTIITKNEKRELLNYGYSIQNRAFLLSENNLDYLNALLPLDSAISFWILIKDSVNEANLRKYKGFLLGRLKKFNSAKKEIYLAIKIFKKLNKEYGVAVSQYDMSLILDIENNLDSALIYQKKASDFWKKKKNSNRILKNNTQLIHLYRRLKKYHKAIEIQKENETLLKTDEHWKPTIDYYYVSYKLYKEINDKEKANLFKELYYNKLNELKLRNIKTKSIYDM